MKIGIVGHPFCGKTTVFGVLTGQSGSGEGGERTHSISSVKVPDPRLDILTELFKPLKKVPAVLEVLDPLGQDPARDQRTLFTTAELEALKKCTALLNVVGCFNESTENVPKTALRDLDALRSEFIVADQAVVENNLAKLSKMGKKKGDPELTRRTDLLTMCLEVLEAGEYLYDRKFSPDDIQALSGYSFLTLKPQLVALNVRDDALPATRELESAVSAGLPAGQTRVLTISGKVERELQDLPPEDQAEFMAALGIETPGIDKVIRACYEMLGLICFFTGGEDETRAWPIRDGENAKEAAGAIHSDISEGFIKAEVVAYEDFVACGSYPACKDKGVLRLEGKDYRVKDGDIITFRFNKPS